MKFVVLIKKKKFKTFFFQMTLAFQDVLFFFTNTCTYYSYIYFYKDAQTFRLYLYMHVRNLLAQIIIREIHVKRKCVFPITKPQVILFSFFSIFVTVFLITCFIFYVSKFDCKNSLTNRTLIIFWSKHKKKNNFVFFFPW